MPDCPTKYKTGVYPTYEKAMAALKWVRRQPDRSDIPKATKVYKCPCGSYHLTGETGTREKSAQGKRRARLKRGRTEDR